MTNVVEHNFELAKELLEADAPRGGVKPHADKNGHGEGKKHIFANVLYGRPLIAAHSLLASHLGDWSAWNGLCILLHASLDAFQNVVKSPATCCMRST